MEVNVHCYSEMKRFAPGGRDVFNLQIDAGSSVADLLQQLAVPEDLNVLFNVNGDRATRETLLFPGDEIVFFVPADGG